MNRPLASPAKAFLGVGWAFPPRLEADGTFAEAIYEADVREAIRIILGTERGERVMRPEFGAGLNTFAFEPLNSTTIAKVTARVRESLIDWEPRIDLTGVTAAAQRGVPNVLLIEMTYRVRATNTLHNL